MENQLDVKKETIGHRIFNTILLRSIESFVSTFVEDSKSIFYDGAQLIHPGEYGKYRENSTKNLLSLLSKHKVSDGFIITSNNKTSTQCDVVIYDNLDFPVLENNLAQFFSIESVISIGEIKSTLTKVAFTKALRKLAENKMLSQDIHGKAEIKKYGDEYDHPISFLVCKNLSFSLNNINFNEIYKDIPQIYWHNAILMVEQGLFTHGFEFKNLTPIQKESFKALGVNLDFRYSTEAPVLSFADVNYNCVPVFSKINKNEPHSHIREFIVLLSQAMFYKTRYSTSIIDYVGYDIKHLFQ